MNELLQNIRYGWRSLRNAPLFTSAVILTLAIGVGLNTAIFTMVDSVLLRPLGYHDADRIVALNTLNLKSGHVNTRIGGADFTDLQQVHGLESVAYYNAGESGVSVNGHAYFLPMGWVSPAFAKVMGVAPVAGTVFLESDTAANKAMVSEAFAREHFGSAEAALGQTVKSLGTYTIVGVLPTGFNFPKQSQIWLEEAPRPDVQNRTAYNQRAIGIRREGVSQQQLDAELDSLSHRLQATYPEEKLHALTALSLQEFIVGNLRPTLRLLMGSVGVVLLIVCANITHLQLVRSTRMRRALSVRSALGATRKDLLLRAITESLLLALAGGVAALGIASIGLRALTHMAPPDTPRLADIHLNRDVFFFSLAVSAVLMLLTSILPVWRSWRLDPATVLRADSERTSESRRSVRLRDGLIIAEVAFTLALSVTAVTLTRQLMHDAQQQLGFQPQHLLMVDTHHVSSDAYPTFDSGDPTPEQLAMRQAWRLRNTARLDALVASVRNTPGVEAAAAIDGAPMGGGFPNVGYAIHGRTVFAPGSTLPIADIHAITPEAFSTMGVPVLRGRNLAVADNFDAAKVLVINQALADEQFPGTDPVGQQIMCGFDSTLGWWTIVGVVGNVRHDAPGTPASPAFYVPLAQHPNRATDIQLIVRTKSDPGVMTGSLRASIQRNFPEVATTVTTLQQNIGESQRSDRFRSTLLASFAAVSLLLAAIGMYGVTAYTVAQRRFEFALRFALGAQRGQLAGMVLRHAAITAALGILAGIVFSIGLVRIVSAAAGKLPPADALSFTIAAAIVFALAVAATAIPSRRAASTELMQALRSE
ncbi:ABC transporter permease [Terriglobus sp. RCC_193]|uniref:ABC transporter permease n=1 Tax=Terriglobus sp. RCC_193 TaxID=3239218 RepID=UPI0035241FCF